MNEEIKKEYQERCKWVIGVILFSFLLSYALDILNDRQLYQQNNPIEEYALYKQPLNEIWETREDLQRYFPDRRNGVDKMEGWTMKMWAEEYGWREYSILKKYDEDAEKNYIYEKYLPLERSLAEISSRVYVGSGENKYNCVNFSEDLQEMLKEKGIESLTISGDTARGRHRWIAVEFEPISGKFIGNNYEADFLREK